MTNKVIEGCTTEKVRRIVFVESEIVCLEYDGANSRSIKYDRCVSVRQFIKEHTDTDGNIYGVFYFAVRLLGVESGTREQCAERCNSLGEPYVVIKVEGNRTPTAKVTIRRK